MSVSAGPMQCECHRYHHRDLMKCCPKTVECVRFVRMRALCACVQNWPKRRARTHSHTCAQQHTSICQVVSVGALGCEVVASTFAMCFVLVTETVFVTNCTYLLVKDHSLGNAFGIHFATCPSEIARPVFHHVARIGKTLPSARCELKENQTYRASSLFEDDRVRQIPWRNVCHVHCVR